MVNFGPIKILFTLVAALLILGPRRLPGAVRNVGRAVSAMRKAGHDVTQELKASLGDEDEPPGPGRAAPAPLKLIPPEERRPGPRG